jgi:hypothetical protein
VELRATAASQGVYDHSDTTNAPHVLSQHALAEGHSGSELRIA